MESAHTRNIDENRVLILWGWWSTYTFIITELDLQMSSASLPVQCNRIDHYTIIVPDAKRVSDFHHQVLGYDFLKLKEINAGSVPVGQVDMLNYIHEWPDRSGRVMVITEGLTDNSIFRRYMSKYGQGIHHVALQVDDLEQAFSTLKDHGVKTTSDNIVIDILSGLKQIFIDNSDTGVFIELIERSKNADKEMDATEKGFFTQDNMAGLADTMHNYIADVKPTCAGSEHAHSSTALAKIATLQIREFVLVVDDPHSSAVFFEKYFGFERSADAPRNTVRIYLTSEPELSFLCVARGGSVNNHQLHCVAQLQGREWVGLPDFKVGADKDSVHITETTSGYSMHIRNCA